MTAKRRRRNTKIDYAELAHILVPYRRVSTREQADSGAGMGAQKTVITRALEYRGATALTWDCVDEGKTGKNMNRAGLDEALELVRSGKAGGIVVSKLDRLSRSFLDFATLAAAARKEGWNIVVLDVDMDLSTPIGGVVANILAAFAEFERQMISQRTKDALAEKKAQGVRIGRPRSIDDDLLMHVVTLYLGSGSFSEVARLLNADKVPPVRGGTQWFPSTVQAMVQGRDALKLIEEVAA